MSLARARADRFVSHAAWRAAVAVAAARHGLPMERVRQPLTLQECARLAGVISRRDARGRAVARRPTAESQALRAVAAARREALYLAVTVFGRGTRSIARVAGVSHKAVSQALTEIEEQRSDRRFDRALDEAELDLMGEMA